MNVHSHDRAITASPYDDGHLRLGRAAPTFYIGITRDRPGRILGRSEPRDWFASIRDIVGGRSGSYEKVLRGARDEALREMQDDAKRLGANAIVGVDIDYGAVGASESMMMVTATGTAVTIG